MMFITHFLPVFALHFYVIGLYLPEANINLDQPEEIQNAICSVTTKEIDATANATITRQLKGVCTSNELNLRIDKLQTKILQEIDGIRYILETNGFKVLDIASDDENPTSDVEFTDNVPRVMTNLTVKLPLRMEEILLYNDTTTDSDEGKKYFYYWKIQNILELLTKSDMYKSSPDFSVLGHSVHLQFYPNYLDANYFAVVLKPDSPGFLKKHRLVILNQLEPGLDLASDVLLGAKKEEKMLRISEQNLKVEGFIMDNSLIVKLEILLES